MTARTLAFISCVACFSGLALADRTPWDWRSLTTPPALEESMQNGLRRGLIVSDTGVLSINDAQDTGQVSLCYAEGTLITPELHQAIQDALQAGFESRYNLGGRWSSTAAGGTGTTGTPITLSWSFAPDGLTVGSGTAPGGTGPSNLFSRMDSLFGAANRSLWVAQFQSVFDRWSYLTGVSYVRVRFNNNDWDDGASWGSAGANNLRGDVRIGMKNIDGANGILAYNSFPNNGDMVIDSSESWNSSSNSYRFLRNTVSHEHGHGLGLSHVCPQTSTKLMEPGLNTGFDGPQQDDIRAGQANYGDPFENNDGPSVATPIDPIPGGAQDPLIGGSTVFVGTIASPSIAFTSLLSIDNNGDSDYYSVVTDQPRLLSVTVVPLGTLYQDYDQNANGSCQTGASNTDAVAQADLVLTVYNTNGTSILRTVNDTPAGQNESITNLLLGPAGTYYFRVSENGSPAQNQCYRLEVQAQNTALSASATDGTLTNQVRVSWTTIPDADSYQVLRSSVPLLGTGSVVATLSAPTTEFFDSPPSNTDVYYYTIRARQPGATVYRYFMESGEPGHANAAPSADAGVDQTVTDVDNSGAELVTLTGASSTDDVGIVNYRWMEGAALLAQGPSPTANVSFSVGVHTVTLTVTDTIGATHTDTVLITVLAGGPNCPPCPADFNDSGGTPDDADVTAFFQAWNDGEECADVNLSGGTPDDADVTMFFELWNAGGC